MIVLILFHIGFIAKVLQVRIDFPLCLY